MKGIITWLYAIILMSLLGVAAYYISPYILKSYNMHFLSKLGLSFIFLGGIGGILLSIGQSHEGQQDKEETLATITGEKKDLERQLKERNKVVDTQNIEIKNLYARLEEKSEAMTEYIVGSTRYPVVMLNLSLNKGHINYNFLLHNKFDAPISSLMLTIRDYSLTAAAMTRVGNKYQVKAELENVGLLESKEYSELTPGVKYLLPTTRALQPSLFHIWMRSRGGGVIEKLACVANGTGTTYAIGHQIFKLNGDFLEENYDTKDPALINKLKEAMKTIPLNIVYTVVD